MATTPSETPSQTPSHDAVRPVSTSFDRSHAEELDRADPLRELRARFVGADDDARDRSIYLDGNSLGRLPVAAAQRLRDVVEREWGRGLVGSWHEWIDLPTAVGDRLGAQLLGAQTGQVAISDSTTVNLYKLAAAALDVRTERRTVITDAGNFPTDRYVLEGLAAARGLRLVTLETDRVLGPTVDDVAAAVDHRSALVCLSHVDYRSGAIADLAEITRVVHDAGALVLWDLCHSVGSIPVNLDAAAVDLAVGCTYKYLDAGPGAPAFLYVRESLQHELRQPIWGWFGQRNQFAMGPHYDPEPGITRFLTGSPNILGITLVDEGVRLLAEAGIERLRAKGVALTTLLIELADAWLAPLGFDVASPRDAARRGSHVVLRHADAYRICRALIERADVTPDYRAPDLVRLGLSALTTSFVDVHDAMARLRDLVATGEYLDVELPVARVT